MPITIDLAGRIAWVTGAGSGIGAAISDVLQAAGARVVGLDRSFQADADVAAAGDIEIGVDLSDVTALQSTADRLAGAGLVPDILVNNAGITRDAPVWRLDEDDWRAVVDVNLSAAFRLVRAVAPAMRDRRSGAIVNVTSINGMRGKFGQSNYSASKGGLIALTRTLARELGPRGIRVNAVAPGMIETPMTTALPDDVRATARHESALGHLGRPGNVADAVLFLVSPLAAHVTGHVLVVDGGQTA